MIWSGICRVNICSLTDKADTIDSRNITADTTPSSDDSGGQVHIRWNDPPSPNGLIVLYDIELHKTGVANVSSHFVQYLLNICLLT